MAGLIHSAYKNECELNENLMMTNHDVKYLYNHMLQQMDKSPETAEVHTPPRTASTVLTKPDLDTIAENEEDTAQLIIPSITIKSPLHAASLPKHLAPAMVEEAKYKHDLLQSGFFGSNIINIRDHNTCSFVMLQGIVRGKFGLKI